MISNRFIFNTLRDNVPALTVGSIVNVFPNRVSKGNLPANLGATYTLINSSIRYNTFTSTYQITCMANNYDDLADFMAKVAVLFSNKIFASSGDPVSSTTNEIVDLGFDDKSQRFIGAVTVTIKSRKDAANQL